MKISWQHHQNKACIFKKYYMVGWIKYELNVCVNFKELTDLKKKRIQDHNSFEGIRETDAVCGCCSFYKKSALKTSGLGDEEFLGPEKDIELSFRLKKIGKILVNLNTYTLHKIARSSEISGKFKRSYTDAVGFVVLKIGRFSDKFFGYSYFLIRMPICYVLKIFF